MAKTHKPHDQLFKQVFGDKEVARGFVYLMQTTELSEEELKALTARSSQSLKELAMTTYQQILNKGAEQERRLIIARMLREGLLSPSQIAKLFNLPEEAVLKIREKLENQ